MNEHNETNQCYQLLYLVIYQSVLSVVAYLGVIILLSARWHVKSGSQLWQFCYIDAITDILQQIKAITNDNANSRRSSDAYIHQWLIIL